MKTRCKPKITKLWLVMFLASALLPWAGIAGADTTLDEQLIKAAAFANLEQVKSLLGQGANVNAKPRDGRTTLMAVASGYYWNLVNGPLKISAVEQTQFLAKLAQDALPFPQEAQKSVREIVLLDQGVNWRLCGKTGWENAPGQGVGWWVGWLEKDGHVHAFALNMDIQRASDGSKRVEVGKASLKALGLL